MSASNAKLRFSGLTSLFFCFSALVISSTAYAQFRGAEYCQNCHEEKYSDWSASAHPYMLMSGDDAQNRSLPLPAGSKWSDISWVVGGFGRKVLYLDNTGHIITTTDDGPGQNQFNLLTGTWTDYHPGENNKPYDCGACHTTNYVETGNQGGLAGIVGTFDVGGIQCEQCHGNNGGEGHMTGPGRIDDSAEACGACHHKAAAPGEQNAIAASNGWIVNGAQFNELKASPHDSFDCTACHDPHKRSEYSIKESAACETCHSGIATSYAENTMADYGVTCTDCHMAQATLSGEPLGPFKGDTKTHLFAINTDANASLFTAQGDFVELDEDGEAGLTVDFACKGCHETTEVAELARFAKNFHGTERDDQEQPLSELHYIGINPGLAGSWWGGGGRSGEGFLFDISYRPNGRVIVAASFYTYDNAGNQAWLFGTKTVDRGDNVVTMNLNIPEGAKWGPDFDPNDAAPFTPWGTAEFMFDSCGTGSFVATPNTEMQGRGYVEYGYDLFHGDLSIPGVACPSMLNDPAILQ